MIPIPLPAGPAGHLHAARALGLPPDAADLARCLDAQAVSAPDGRPGGDAPSPPARPHRRAGA